MVDRLLRRLDALDAAAMPEELNQPGFNFHALSGNRQGTYTVHINGPWCLTFEWDGADAIRVDLEQYH
jgi:proteic killer suppression protein